MRNIVKELRPYYLGEGFNAKDLDEKVTLADVRYGIATCGPGYRVEMFFQGCSRHCKGCFNVHLWSFKGALTFPVADVLGMIDPTLDPGYYANRDLATITIGGGEPFQQMDGLLALMRSIRKLEDYLGHPFHVIIYSGFTYEELWEGTPQTDRKMAREVLKLTNILIDGPYEEDKALMTSNSSFIGSWNQRYLILNKGKVAKEIGAIAANSDVGDIAKVHLLEAEREALSK